MTLFIFLCSLAASTTFILGGVTPTTVEVLWQTIPTAQQYTLTLTWPDGEVETFQVEPGVDVMNVVFEDLAPGFTYTVGLTALTPEGTVSLGTLNPTTPGKY